MRLAQISDTHIKNLKYHAEYRIIFEQIYDKLRELEVDYIVHLGDLCHTKTQISPEYVEMASVFLKNLADIAPTFLILGNHDCNVKNRTRQDSISPIVDALDHRRLYFLKNSIELKVTEELIFNCFSIVDKDNWIETPTYPDAVNIALFHGSVSGVTTDTGHVIEHGDIELIKFRNFDYVFLGDVHKANQNLDDEGRIRYAGSTVQQHHGETNDKGFLVWDIVDKETFDVRHVHLPNPKPFITIELTPKGRIPKKAFAPEGARVRLVSNHSLPIDRLRKVVDVVKMRFKPESVTFLNRAAGKRGSVEIDELDEDLRDLAVQERLIREYLKDYEVEEETILHVLTLNRKFNSIIEESENIQRNVNWDLRRLEWDNLFNYGKGNKIDFSKLHGIAGIFGKNYSGKSSIIDVLLFALFNTTSKNVRKNLDLINQNKDKCRAEVEIEIGNLTYTVIRESEKYVKKLAGDESIEAKTVVDFSVIDAVSGEVESLNGITRIETDKNIRKVFGTMEDFLLTSMASQLDSLAFIGKGSTDRKAILAKFLDLRFFEKKFRAAREEAAEFKALIKRLEGIDFSEQIGQAEKDVAENDAKTEEEKGRCTSLKDRKKLRDERIFEIDTIIASMPDDVASVDAEEEQLEVARETFGESLAEQERLKAEVEDRRSFVEKIEKFLEDTFDIDEYQEREKIIVSKRSELDGMINEINHHEIRLSGEQKKISLLEEVPCGSEFSHCKFIKDAYGAKRKIEKLETELRRMEEKKSDQGEAIEDLNPEQVQEYIDKYNRILEKRNEVIGEVSSFEILLANTETDIARLSAEIETCERRVLRYNEIRDIVDSFGALAQERDVLIIESDIIKGQIEACEDLLAVHYQNQGSYAQRLAHIQEQRAELGEYRKQYSAYDLFMRCMHTNGISLDIIRRKLPVVNREIAAVLASVVNFEVYMHNEDKKLEIFIKHPKYDPRRIETGSGAEKTIAAMAIRLALLNVSSLPKSDVFILDEPATALDEEHLESFTQILDLVKNYFNIVLLISHLDSLKDNADSQITIEKKRGFAHVHY